MKTYQCKRKKKRKDFVSLQGFGCFKRLQGEEVEFTGEKKGIKVQLVLLFVRKRTCCTHLVFLHGTVSRSVLHKTAQRNWLSKIASCSLVTLQLCSVSWMMD